MSIKILQEFIKNIWSKEKDEDFEALKEYKKSKEVI